MQNDVIVIGAGVVGCLTARSLSRYNLRTLVVEAGGDVAEGASKANSAIVHAGFDAKPGTNKAKFNVLGNRMFENVCKELKVPFKRNGSLVLAFSDEERRSLEELKERAGVNGVPVEIIGQDELRAREPNVSPEAVAALWAPTGGICCPYQLTFRAAENAAANGVAFAFDAEVTGLRRIEGGDPGWELTCADGRRFTATCVINCAGIHSDELNNLVSAKKYSIQARRGEYLMLDRDEEKSFSATMFQVPSKMGKGILVSPTVDGTVIVGPTAEDIPDKEDKATTYDGLEKVKAGAKRTWPGLPLNKVITEFSGLRAHETTIGDFILGEAPDAPCFFNAVGVESPGLTSAPALGEHLSGLVVERLNGMRTDGVRVSQKAATEISLDVSDWPVTHEMPKKALAELIKKEPAFGRVICRCEEITEGEIRAAIRARVGARTLDGIKRRTRSGMGRCQGGFCTPRLIEILGEELGLPPEAFLASRKKAPAALRAHDAETAAHAGDIWDVTVIGAGPAGLAAACAAKEAGASNVLVLERDDAAGGILQQCIHNGFGLHRFKEELTGPEYAKRYIDMAKGLSIPMRCGTMVVEFAKDADGKLITVTTMSRRDGLQEIKTRAVVLAMGCRERPRGALMTPGTRPAGVYTAGTVQRLVNMDGIMPGKRVVILGSGDIGLIMARRLTFQGAKVLACIEIMKKSSGLMRNVVQCLQDYDIPLLLSHTVTDVEGTEHVTGVKVSQVDDNLKPIPGTEIHYDCDTLLLSCGLIPENELTKAAGIEIDPKTRGPKVDASMATSMPGVFAGGNVVRVYDLVDWVSRDSEIAGRSAAKYALDLH